MFTKVGILKFETNSKRAGRVQGWDYNTFSALSVPALNKVSSVLVYGVAAGLTHSMGIKIFESNNNSLQCFIFQRENRDHYNVQCLIITAGRSIKNSLNVFLL